MITAIELLDEKFPHFEDLDVGNIWDNIEQTMIEFAKLHVEAQAEEIYNKGLNELTKWEGNPYTGEGSDYLDKDSILNAYPLTNIK